MKKIMSLRMTTVGLLSTGLSCATLLISACSPVDSVRTLDQQQTERLVRSMYPVHTSSQLAGISKNN